MGKLGLYLAVQTDIARPGQDCLCEVFFFPRNIQNCIITPAYEFFLSLLAFTEFIGISHLEKNHFVNSNVSEHTGTNK